MANPDTETSAELERRIARLAREWNVSIERVDATPSSVICHGVRGTAGVVLKVARRGGDEWRCGEILAAFGGRGVIETLEHAPGAVLMPLLSPATQLTTLAVDGRDDEATAIVASVISAIHAVPAAATLSPTVEEWGRGFDRQLASDDRSLDPELVAAAREEYARLCATQRERRLLHGDLQHYNILLDADRGWIAIDPKGVIGEPEYEVGAFLRNPIADSRHYASSVIVSRRLAIVGSSIPVDIDRAMRWAFTQAVLSAVWSVEDGDDSSGAIALALALCDVLR